jgi:hypothetical protein
MIRKIQIQKGNLVAQVENNPCANPKLMKLHLESVIKMNFNEEATEELLRAISLVRKYGQPNACNDYRITGI